MHLRALADDAVGAEVLERVLAHVRDVARDLLGAELRVARAAVERDDVERREHVLAHEALVDEDGVLEVVAAPAHERHEQVLAERELALVGGGAVRQAVARLHLLAVLDDRLLVEARARVAAAELLELVAPDALLGLLVEVVLRGVGGLGVDALRQLAVRRGEDHGRRDVRHDAVLLRAHDHARVLRGHALEARAHVRALALQERHALAHHVRAHERAVRVVGTG